jgi:hypothetical protein
MSHQIQQSNRFEAGKLLDELEELDYLVVRDSVLSAFAELQNHLFAPE